jgi:signal transduction histidine kinase
MRYLGGEFEIDSAPRQGTRVRVHVGLAGAEK